MSAAKSRKGAAVLLSVLAVLSARAEVLRILDFEDRNERFEARACDGCSAAFSTNFATSGSSSLRLHSRSWQSKADKCTKATFPVDADFSRFDRIAFDVRLDHVKGCGGTITFSGGSFIQLRHDNAANSVFGDGHAAGSVAGRQKKDDFVVVAG